MDGDVWFLLGYGLAWVGSGGSRATGLGKSSLMCMLLCSASFHTKRVQDLAIAELWLIRGVHCS